MHFFRVAEAKKISKNSYCYKNSEIRKTSSCTFWRGSKMLLREKYIKNKKWKIWGFSGGHILISSVGYPNVKTFLSLRIFTDYFEQHPEVTGVHIGGVGMVEIRDIYQNDRPLGAPKAPSATIPSPDMTRFHKYQGRSCMKTTFEQYCSILHSIGYE